MRLHQTQFGTACVRALPLCINKQKLSKVGVTFFLKERKTQHEVLAAQFSTLYRTTCLVTLCACCSTSGCFRCLLGLRKAYAHQACYDYMVAECRRLRPEDLQCIIPLPSLPNWAWQQRTWVMGILNVTPDSFSDGGQIRGVEEAVAHACSMIQVRCACCYV